MGVSDWAFADPMNRAVITAKDVTEEGALICNVYHHHDGDWEFYSSEGPPVSLDMFRVVALHELVDLDPSLETLAHLPYGWCAHRENKDSPWVIEPFAPSPEDLSDDEPPAVPD